MTAGDTARGGKRSVLQLYNTLTRTKEPFTPRQPGTVRFFTCGPSIYQPPHVGNYRTFLYEDVLHRYLKYLGYRVEWVLPFTDVEDKAFAEAEHLGVSLQELTDRIAARFHEEARMLRIHPPTFNPRSSTTVEEAAGIIQTLLAKGHAYRDGKDIFFDPMKYPGFGRLARIDLSRWPRKRRRFRKDTYPGARWNYGDFILWCGEEGGNAPVWETVVGRGRPSWNVQDPAMVLPFLGPSIDIHAGGIDNLARHHDYVLAIMESVTGKPYTRFWLHGGHLLIGGKKMSKSRGNIVYPATLLSEGYTPEQIRFYLILGHYRRRKNLLPGKLKEAADRLARVRQAAASLEKGGRSGVGDTGAVPLLRSMEQGFRDRMNDDLDVAGAWAHLERILWDLEGMAACGRLREGDANRATATLRRIDSVLQVIYPVAGPEPES
jgi:cysteinyl-tRNA synthetase